MEILIVRLIGRCNCAMQNKIFPTKAIHTENISASQDNGEAVPHLHKYLLPGILFQQNHTAKAVLHRHGTHHSEHMDSTREWQTGDNG